MFPFVYTVERWKDDNVCASIPTNNQLQGSKFNDDDVIALVRDKPQTFNEPDISIELASTLCLSSTTWGGNLYLIGASWSNRIEWRLHADKLISSSQIQQKPFIHGAVLTFAEWVNNFSARRWNEKLPSSRASSN